MKKLTILALLVLALVAVGCTEKTTIVSPTDPPVPVTVLGSCFAESMSIFCIDSSTGDITSVKWSATLNGIVRASTTGSQGSQATLTVATVGGYVVAQEVSLADGTVVRGSDIPVTVSGF